MFFYTVDIFDNRGRLVRVEAFDKDGEFIMQALWDPSEEQTAFNRANFRQWFIKHLERSISNESGG